MAITSQTSLPRRPETISQDAAWVAANFAEPRTAPFSRGDLSELSKHLVPRVIESGEVLFHEGENPAGVWILQSGAIELIYGSGETRALIRMLNPGESVGDVHILRGVSSPYKARAAESSTCLFIERSKFGYLFSTVPAVSRRWATKLALQVSRNHTRIVGLLTTSLRDRLAAFLLHESVDGIFRHSQGTIASMLGVHRSSINQVLGEFERLGLVKVAYRCIELRDEHALKLMSEGRFSAHKSGD